MLTCSAIIAVLGGGLVGVHQKAIDVCTFAYRRGGGSPAIGPKHSTKHTIVVQISGARS